MTLGEHKVIGVFRERVQAMPGSTLSVRPDVANIHLFDVSTGLRIN
jgi:multiple sugar transport system ATP-binding protein